LVLTAWSQVRPLCGRAVILKQHQAKVGIPELVRLAVSRQREWRLIEHIETINSEYRKPLTAFGKLL
jgi:hypothetical protein